MEPDDEITWKTEIFNDSTLDGALYGPAEWTESRHEYVISSRSASIDGLEFSFVWNVLKWWLKQACECSNLQIRW